MISLFTSSRPSLKITVEQDIIYLHPQQNFYSTWTDEPTIDPEVRGMVLLTLPQTRRLNGLKVVFEGLCNAWGGDGFPYESNTTLHKELNIDLHNEVLEAGDHAFNFSFIIPSNTAVYQRCNFGRVRHYVKAYLDYGAGFSSSTVTSSPVGIFISAQPTANVGDIPEPMDILINSVSDDLGPLRLGFNSPHLTPASLLSMHLTFLAPPSPLKVHSIKALLHQQFSIQYPKAERSEDKVGRPREGRYVLQRVERPEDGAEVIWEEGERISNEGSKRVCREKASNIGCRAMSGEEENSSRSEFELREGEERKYESIMRLPNDDHVRPTTFSGTNTRIRLAHRLSIEVCHQCPKSGEEKLFVTGKNVIVSCCCNVLDTLYLPAYQKYPTKTITRPRSLTCLCSMSLREVFDSTGMGLERERALRQQPFLTDGGRVSSGRNGTGGSVAEIGTNVKSPSMEWVQSTEGVSVSWKSSPSGLIHRRRLALGHQFEAGGIK